jgi:hypothetical protein
VRARNAAAREFILFDAKRLYQAKLEETRLEQSNAINSVSDGQISEMAAERAYKAVLQEMQTRNLDWLTLRNLLSLRASEPELFFDLEPVPPSTPQAAA